MLSLSLYLSTRMRAFAKKYEDLGRYKHGDFSRSSGYITTREDPIRPYIYKYFRRNKVYASWKLDKASISVNRGTHFQVHFVWQVWDSWLSPAFESTRLKAFGGWKFDRGTPKLHASVLPGKGRRRRNQTCSRWKLNKRNFCPTSAYKQIHAYTYIYIYTHKKVNVHVHVYIHTHTQSYTHTRTRTHT